MKFPSTQSEFNNARYAAERGTRVGLATLKFMAAFDRWIDATPGTAAADHAFVRLKRARANIDKAGQS